MDLTKGSCSDQEEEEQGRKEGERRPRDLKNRLILYSFRKTPSRFAFFFRKMAKYDLKLF